jgi:hypothetical protein
MSTAQEIALHGISELGPILDKSGGVFYSDASSIRPSPIYLLGLNPGGAPEHQPNATVRASLEAFPSKKINDYLDDDWASRDKSWGKGQAPLQKRVTWLLEQLKQNPRSVPSSNLIFIRSDNSSHLAYHELADLCWKLHDRVLNIVSPKLLLVFGVGSKSPYNYLYNRYKPSNEQLFPSGHGNWVCRSFRTDNFTVIGLPHLSRYNVIDKYNVIHWIKVTSQL